MAKATRGFHGTDPATGAGVFYAVGDPVPDEVAARSPEVVDEVPSLPDDAEPGAGDRAGFEEAVQAAVVERLDAAHEDGARAQRGREESAYDQITGGDAFDPSADGVKAADVREYLEGLDRGTVIGQREWDRVVDAERDGADRKSAIPQD